MTTEPVASRLRLPADYGLPQDSPLLSWPAVDERLASGLHYWLSTADVEGAPIIRPIDGMWVEGALYFGGHPNTRWRRNLAANPRTCVSLEDAESAVILEGSATTATPDAVLAAKLFAQAKAKYEFAANQTADEYRGQTCVFRPRHVLAWSLLYKDATRFDFP